MLIIVTIMIVAASLSAFSAPIGPSALGLPPLRMAPTGPQTAPSGASPATQPPAGLGAGPMPRGALLNLSV